MVMVYHYCNNGKKVKIINNYVKIQCHVILAKSNSLNIA